MSELAAEVGLPDRTLPALLRRGADRWGERTLIRWDGGRRTYREVLEATAATAATLGDAGVRRGDRVAIMAGNRIELLDTWLACGWLGAIAVPINTALRGVQLEHVFATSTPRLLVADGAVLEHLDRLEQDPASLERVWRLEDSSAATEAIAPGGRRIPVEAMPVAEPARRADPAAVLPGDTWTILYTSGTTGPSKAVQCPHAQLFWWGALTGRHLAIGRDDVLHTFLPMFHTNALNTLVQALLVGATYSFGERFSASRFWDGIREREATVTYVLGAMVHILLGHDPDPRDRDHRLRVALSPATPAEHVEAFRERFGVELVEGYGSTETNMIMCNRRDGELRAGTMGWVVDGFEAAAVDEYDRAVPDGTPGELVVRHAEPFSVATGYFGMPEKTVEAWRNLWFHTGDRVVRDAEGVFRFVDRMKDAIRRRGENVSSYEVEQALLTHPDVMTAAVVPVPSELGEDEVMAFVVRRPGADPAPEELVAHCEPRLAYFAIPRYVEFLDELPLTENGKVRKPALRERGVGERTWDREAAGVRLRR